MTSHFPSLCPATLNGPEPSRAEVLLMRIGLTADAVRKMTAPPPVMSSKHLPHSVKKTCRVYGSCQSLILDLARIKRQITVEDVMRELPDHTREQLTATLASMKRRGHLVCLLRGTPGTLGHSAIYTTRDHAQSVKPGTK